MDLSSLESLSSELPMTAPVLELGEEMKLTEWPAGLSSSDHSPLDIWLASTGLKLSVDAMRSDMLPLLAVLIELSARFEKCSLLVLDSPDMTPLSEPPTEFLMGKGLGGSMCGWGEGCQVGVGRRDGVKAGQGVVVAGDVPVPVGCCAPGRRNRDWRSWTGCWGSWWRDCPVLGEGLGSHPGGDR